MANVLAHLSSILIPAVIFFIIGYGWIHKCNLYDDFINGAADGLKTVVGIVPTLIGLMMAVGILRGSGLLDLPGKLLQKYAADSSISGMFPEFFFRGDWTGARYFQNLRDRFSGRPHHVDSDELHRNLFLHDVCLFYDGARFQIQIYAGRRAAFYRCRCRYERAAGISDVNFHKNSGQLRIERCVTARLQNMLLFSIQMLYQQSISDPSPCKKSLPQTY